MALDLYKYVASVPDYPEKGIIFRDILPLMADGAAFKQATDELVDYAKDKKVDMVVGPEARGFIVGCPIARELGVGFAPARKKGKLPRKAISASYDLEYGTATLQMEADAIKPGQVRAECGAGGVGGDYRGAVPRPGQETDGGCLSAQPAL